MKKTYLYISNGNKPTKKEFENKEEIKLTNVAKPGIEAAIRLGYHVVAGVNRKYAEEIVSNEYDIKFYNQNIYRNIFDIKNILIAYKNAIEIIKNENVEVIHCNTPLGGLIGRIVGKNRKVDTIIYTVHGFHFYKGNNWFKNIVFNKIEKTLAKYTDVIITINTEDYEAAKKFSLKNNGKVYYVPGVGIDTTGIKKIVRDKEKLCQELGVKTNSILLISVGDLNENKNNEVILRALKRLKNPNLHYLICGEGPQKKYLIELTKTYGLNKNIHFLGYRKDIPRLLKSSDIFIMPSFREGLSRSLMEAMSAGLPSIVSNIRGNSDLIKNNIGGYLINPTDSEGFRKAINDIANNKELRKKMGDFNEEAVSKYDEKNIREMINLIYKEELGYGFFNEN